MKNTLHSVRLFLTTSKFSVIPFVTKCGELLGLKRMKTKEINDRALVMRFTYREHQNVSWLRQKNASVS